MLTINEPINVWVFFQKAKISPYVFFWQKRRIKVESINMIHTSKEGNATLYHFCVTAEGNFYKLVFNSLTLKWVLEQVEESWE